MIRQWTTLSQPLDLLFIKANMATMENNSVQVIVVGLGIAGLATAIECQEKGHSVIAYEKTDILKPVGMEKHNFHGHIPIFALLNVMR